MWLRAQDGYSHGHEKEKSCVLGLYGFSRLGSYTNVQFLTIFEAKFQVGQSFFMLFAFGMNSRLFAWVQLSIADAAIMLQVWHRPAIAKKKKIKFFSSRTQDTQTYFLPIQWHMENGLLRQLEKILLDNKSILVNGFLLEFANWKEAYLWKKFLLNFFRLTEIYWDFFNFTETCGT